MIFIHRGTKGTLWEGGTRAVTFVHSALLPAGNRGRVKEGLFHIVDWAPTLASLAGVPPTTLASMGLDGLDQRRFIMEEEAASAREHFVYNIKTAPFKVKKYFKNIFSSEFSDSF